MTQAFHLIDIFSFEDTDRRYELALASERKSSSKKNDDVISAEMKDGKLVILVADGATGFGFGHVASQSLSNHVAEKLDPTLSARQMKAFLLEADSAVKTSCAGDAEGADTTAVLLTISNSRIEGASVGDSQAILFGASHCDLTYSQRKRPRLGNGGYPQDFTSRIAVGDYLVVATDGLWNRLDLDEVGRICIASNGPDRAVAKLLAYSRTVDGGYDDDISIACVHCVR